jgi:anti-sigma factor RsiW
MANDTSTTHLTPEELAAYFAGRVDERHQEAIEMHLGGCDACTDEARQYRAFSAVWDEWTMPAPEETWEQVALAHALQRIQSQVDNPQWVERLRRWQTHWAGQAEAAVRLMLAAADHSARLITVGLEALIASGPTWNFALGVGPIRVRGPAVQAQTSMPSTPQAHLRARETAPGAQELQLRVEALPSQQVLPLVILIPIDMAASPLVAELMPTPDGMSCVARFNEVPYGEYLVAVEPRQDTGT